MNPYEKTAEEMRRQSEGPKRLAKTALSIGSAAATAAGATAFAPILAKAAPFLSQYIPEKLAIQGLSKINPKLGKFVQTALNSGYDFGEVRNFIGEQIKESQTPQPKDNRNIIEQESPELHQFIVEEIKNGRNHLQAGAIAQNDKRFSEVIKKLSNSHKLPWSQILSSVYENQEKNPETKPDMPNEEQINPQLAQLLQQGSDILQKFRAR